MPRSIETRQHIANTLVRMLQNHSIENIHVSDICRRCNISRTTFYVYFEDIHAVIQWMWDEVCAHSLYHINDTLTWDEGHLIMLKELYENKSFYQRAFTPKDFQSLFSYGYRKSLVMHIENLERKLNRQLTEEELSILDYTVRAFSAMTTKWAEEGMDLTPDQVVAIFSRFVPEFAE